MINTFLLDLNGIEIRPDKKVKVVQPEPCDCVPFNTPLDSITREEMIERIHSEQAAQKVRKQVLPTMMERLEQRQETGIRKYGEPLTTHNGRSALLDALDEALDLSMYLTQKCLEEGVL